MIPFGSGVKRARSSGVEGAICSLLRFRLVGRCLAVKETGAFRSRRVDGARRVIGAAFAVRGNRQVLRVGCAWCK